MHLLERGLADGRCNTYHGDIPDTEMLLIYCKTNAGIFSADL
jgi:hypothetical protein